MSQFAAIIRMRFRMARNAFRKAGRANAIVMAVLIGIAGIASLGSFVFALGWGRFFLSKMEPFYTLYVWDILCGAFLFAWSIAMMVELQRSEMMSLKNLLHLPISLRGAFFLNYLSSLFSFTILLFLPALVGLCCACVLTYGPRSLVTFGLLLAFLFMVTGVWYLIRGWLARLMENKRTRGTVISLTVMFFVLMVQIPNIINLSTIRSRHERSRQPRMAYHEQVEEYKQQFEAGEITKDEHVELATVALEEFKTEEKETNARRLESINRTATVLNLALPVGWLPYGASAAAQGAVFVPLLLILGMALIGVGALMLSYRQTVRTYTGYHSRTYKVVEQKVVKSSENKSLIDRKVPLLSDAQSVIATSTLQSLLRAPEAKMALLTPLIFVCIFGSMMFSSVTDVIPTIARPLLGIGAIGMSMMGMVQLMINMFGIDRQGFRAYVLMPVKRSDIVFGKNMGMLPVGLLLTAALTAFIQVVFPMRLSHFVATLIHIPLGFLMYFTVSNYTSIVAPIGMAAGTMKPVSPNFSVMVIQFVAVFLSPLSMLPALIALGMEFGADTVFGVTGVPVYLIVTLVQAPLIFLFYRWMTRLQGNHLWEREQSILEVISKGAS